MSDHEINVKVKLDDSEAQKKLNDLTKKERKIDIDVDTSDIDQASKKVDGLKNKDIKVDAKVTGKEAIDSTAKSLDKATKSASSFGNTVKGFAKFGGYLEVFQLIKRGAQEAVQAIKEIDDAIVDLQMATGDSYANVRQLVSGYNELAKNLGATITEMTRGADTWLRQGKSISETNQLLQDTMVLSKVAQIDSDDSSSYLTAIMKGYKMAADEVAGINDSLTSIDLAAAVDAGGLAEATSRVAASADLAGVSLNRLLGYEAAVGEASQESMSVIGNAFKSIFSRMSNIKAGNLELIDEDGTTQTLSDVETVFSNIGVPLRDSANEFRNFGDVLDEVAAKWSNLSSVQQAAVSQSLGGVFQSNRVKLLFENYDKALQYEQIAESSSGTAMAKFEDGYLNSIEAKTKSLQAAFEGLSSNLISRDTINGILEATQALVEFLDKTNLVKGALAGIAVGGALKGFSLISAGIVKATANITSFGDAAKKDFSALKANPIGVISTVVGLATAAWSSYNQAIEESIQKAKDVTSAWDESNTSLNEQISKYKELKSQLDSGTLTPDEEYSTRQQILDLQTQITSQYGDQVEGVNLVNGALDDQIAKLQQIATENAKTTLNKSMEEYDKATEQMEKMREYTLGTFGGAWSNNDQLNRDLQRIAKEYEDAGIKLDNTISGTDLETDEYTITFEGDVTQADKTVTDFLNRVSDLRERYVNDANATDVIDTITGNASSILKKNQEILDDYQESYNKFLQMDMMSRGTGEGSVADTYNKYAEAVQAYNEALASGDSDAISKARADFNELSGEVDTLLSKGDNDKFTVLFDEITDSLDDASIKLNDFNEALNGKAGDTNTFKDQAENIKNASDALKAMKLDAVDALNALETAGEQDGENELWTLAYNWGITSKSSAEDIKAFVDILSEAGIVTGTVASATDAAAESYESYSSAVQSAAESLATLQSIMSESVSGSGISDENVQALKEMFTNPSDFSAVLEKTANGYHLNKEALAELQAQQETLTKSDYLSALSDQYELLEENAQKLAKAQFMGEDTSGLEATRQGILDQITSLEDLQYQYEAATSAYQDWQNAMSGGEEGDMYDSIFGNIEDAEDLYDKGLTGTNKFREFVDLMSNQDLSTASNEEIVSAYEKAIPKIKRYFTEGQEGAVNFLKDIQNLNSEWAHMNSDGSWDIDFGVGNDQEIADKLGIDVEAVQSIMRKLSDYGFEINLDEPVASMEELKSSAQSAQEALAKMKDTSLSDINLDSNSFSEITDDIAQVEEYIDEISDSDLEPDVKTEKLENANSILEYLVEMQNEVGNNSIEISVNSEELERKISDAKAALDAFKNDDGQVDLSVEGAQEAVDNLQTLLAQKEQLNTPAVMAVDTSQVDGELGDAIAKIQEYQNAVQDLAVQTELKAQGVDIDTSAAQEKVNNLAAEIQGLNPDITAKLNIDTSSTASLQSSIQAITPEILVKAGVDETAIVNYTPSDKDASVKYKVDASAVNQWNAPDKTATLTYNITTAGTLPGNKNRTLTYTIKTEGSAGVNGTAHANGTTVKSYRFNNWRGQANASGNWGIKKGGKSLVGETGQEILVRGSEFQTIGDYGPEFIDTQPGDIIFNAEQTKSLLENGYATSRGKVIGSANADGSAYSSGSGKFNVGSSGSKANSSSSSSSSSSSTSSTSTSSTKSAQKAAESVSEAADEFEESFDQIEILLDRMDRSLQKLTDSIETYSYDLSKQSSVSDQAMNQIRNNLTTLQQAYNRYIQEANNVGLDESWASRVRDGSINIETITDEDLKDKIDEYQQWLRISGHLIYFIAGTSPQPCFATT